MKLLKALGVEVSRPKTYVSDIGLEFAKRLFYRGIDISPFPVSGIVGAGRDYLRVVPIFCDLLHSGG